MSEAGELNNLDTAPTPVKGVRRKPEGLPKTTRIILEESELIPPTGLFIGLNGTSYILVPGVPADVPPGVLEVLDNAVMSAPVKDTATGQVIGYRDRRRYNYRYV